MSDLEQQLTRQQWRPVPPQWRDEILATAKRAKATNQAEERQPVPWWRSLFWPSPRVCAGFATVWLLLGLAHLAMPSVEPRNLASASVQSGNIAEAWREQQKLVTELFPAEYHPQPAKAALPRRRGDCRQQEFFV